MTVTIGKVKYTIFDGSERIIWITATPLESFAILSFNFSLSYSWSTSCKPLSFVSVSKILQFHNTSGKTKLELQTVCRI